MRTHLLNRTRTDTDNGRPRSWWSTALSLTIHGTIIALLWSAPSLPINTPEVAPPESIDATILPPPPAEKPAEKPDTPPTPAPNAHAPASSPTTPHVADNKPASAPSGTPKADPTTRNAADGAQVAKGQTDGKGNTPTTTNGNGIGGNSKKLTAGAPVAVAPSGGFQIDYNVDASGGNDSKGSGGGQLIFTRKDNRYMADLNVKLNVAPRASISFISHSEGVVRKDTVASERFSNIIDMPIGSKWDKQSSFVVDYANNKATFTNKGNNFERDLTHDALYDYVSAMAYLQAGFQQGQLKAGQSDFNLPIGKREEIALAHVSVGDTERVSTFETAGEAIPVKISINSGSIKSIQVWFFPEKKYLPLKMEIVIEKYTVVLLSRKSN